MAARQTLCVLAVFAGAAACPSPPGPGPAPVDSARGEVSAKAGEPLPGLDDAGLARFEAGFAKFTEVIAVEGGLGPLYNAHSCSQCHGIPAVGGQGGVAITRAGYARADGGFEAPPGGSLIPAFSIAPLIAGAAVPADATVVTHRRTLPLFGAGLLEAVEDAALEARAASTRAFGVKGGVGWVSDPLTHGRRAGRFGWKAAHATVLSFAAVAARDELGLTNPLVPEEIVPFGDPAVLAKMDHVPDPELSLAALQSFADFTRLLAAPERGAITADVEAGTRVFAATGCAECHLPSWTTGSSADAVLSGRTFAPYSDLLLHDLGIADGVPQGDASGREIRTPPLWGLRFRSDLLHDGSASSVTEALAQHGGEAAEVRRRFESLSGSERAQLFAFLRSL